MYCEQCDRKGKRPEKRHAFNAMPLDGDQIYRVGSEKWCGVCVEANSSVCEVCDRLIPGDDVHGDTDCTVCYDCAEIPVQFRVTKHGSFKGSVTAVLPTMASDYNGNLTCYEHVGQHGSCSLAWIREKTRKATPEEYAPLLRELTQVYEGYRLRVVERGHGKYRDMRRAQCA